MNFVGAHNDAGNTRRVEMFQLLNPLNGTFPVVVSVSIPVAQTVGVVAGATTFTGVDQTVPIGTFVSANGAAQANSQLDVPSVVNGMVIDTLATGGDQTVQYRLLRFRGGTRTAPPRRSHRQMSVVQAVRDQALPACLSQRLSLLRIGRSAQFPLTRPPQTSQSPPVS